MAFVTKLDKTNPKFTWSHRRHKVAKATLSKKIQTGSITIPDLKAYNKAIVIKTA